MIGIVVSLCLMAGSPEKPIDFESVRPILQHYCHECHGPRKQESELRLDLKRHALRGGFDGPVIVPGDPSSSPLIVRISSSDGDVRMPPTGAPLTSSEQALLRRWIAEGASWPDDPDSSETDLTGHWAFRPPIRPELPSLRENDWVRNPIDRFILAHLEAEGLSPSPEADSAAQLRRLHLDLVGLPPSPAELEDWLRDPSETAWETRIETLLQSPHFGERWGRLWLDAARYADSDGYEKDKPRIMWFYRDWVIRALVDDMPFDTFVLKQLAGDLLPGASQEDRVATGFLRNSMINEEGGIDPEQFRWESLFDRMDAIGKSFLGLTIACAQCHNHKYDPLTQEEYFRLAAFLNTQDEPMIAVFTPEEQQRRQAIFTEIDRLEEELRRQHPDWNEQFLAWQDSLRVAPEIPWHTVAPSSSFFSLSGTKFEPQVDGSFLAGGYSPGSDNYQLAASTALQQITAFRLDALTDANLPLAGPGRSYNGTFALSEFEVEIAPYDDPKAKQRVKFFRAEADYSEPEKPLSDFFKAGSDKPRRIGPVAWAIDGDETTAWAIDAGVGRRNADRHAVFLCEAPVGFPQGSVLSFTLKQRHGGDGNGLQCNSLGRFRLSVTDAENPSPDPMPHHLRSLLDKPAAERSASENRALFQEFRKTFEPTPAWKETNAAIERWMDQLPEGTTALTLAERPVPRNTHVLKRGNFLDPGPAVNPDVPEILHPWPAGAPRDRRGLAAWITDRNSPTTARVVINRIWQAYFGRGLVETTEDFGVQGSPPSHPELLDWLAVELMENGWRLNPIHRLIVTSAVYRQSSSATPELIERDPTNRLLARGARFRLDAEVVRDLALAASGLLHPTIGGRSVYPPIPDNFQALSYDKMDWPTETGPDRYRRSIYTYRRRSMPHPVLQTFDAPNGDFSCVRRPVSNTPMQALVLLNEPVAIECAQALAQAAVREAGPGFDDRLRVLFQRVLGRSPDATESRELRRYWELQCRRFAEGWTSPALVALGSKASLDALPKGVTPTELGGWMLVARVLLNLDEAVTRE